MAVCDDAQCNVACFEVRTTLQGLSELIARLGEFEVVAGVAIEAYREPVLLRLLEEGYDVYPINPKLSYNWRKCVSVADFKSDARDAGVLARELSRRHQDLRKIGKQDPAVQEFVGLSDVFRLAIKERSRLVLRLRSTLDRYYPAAPEMWSDLTTPTSWAFIKKLPTPEVLSRARKSTLIKFLKRHNIGLSPRWLKRIERAPHAAEWPTSPRAEADKELALACIAQLDALQR